jgi:excisionase family DNA binding protein
MNTKTAEKKIKRIEREPPMAEQYAFSVNQAARMMSLSRSSLLKEIKDGELPTIRRRGRVLILAEQLKNYLNKEQQLSA